MEIGADVQVNGAGAAVKKHGAEPTYLAMVKLEAPLMFSGVDSSKYPEVVGTGRYVCGELDLNKTFDQVFMDAYDQSGLSGDDTDGSYAELIWASILPAPETLCTKHAAALEEWKASAD